MKWQPNMDYVEVHIWGELNLDDVALFRVELLKRGIEVRRAPKQ